MPKQARSTIKKHVKAARVKKERYRKWILGLLIALLVLLAGAAVAWRVLVTGGEQWTPVPPVVTPAPFKNRPPPPDAIVLFGGEDLSGWRSMDGKPARWDVQGGAMTVRKGSGNIRTVRRFADYALHLEWRIPGRITGEGQARGNSGLFLASIGTGDQGYEIQILDSYRNKTYVNGQAGAIYKQRAPLANPMRPPGEWQSYDVQWKAPRFAADGALVKPARVSVWMNDVLVQDDVALQGETVFIGKPTYRAHGPSPIMLQDHRDPSPPISFRNIWVREIAD